MLRRSCLCSHPGEQGENHGVQDNVDAAQGTGRVAETPYEKEAARLGEAAARQRGTESSCQAAAVGSTTGTRAATILLAACALAAIAANSVLCRLALASNPVDPAAFSAIRLGSGAITLATVAALASRGKRAGSWGSAAARRTRDAAAAAGWPRRPRRGGAGGSRTAARSLLSPEPAFVVSRLPLEVIAGACAPS